MTEQQSAIWGLTCFPCIALVTYKLSCFLLNVYAIDPSTDMINETIDFSSINLISCFPVRKK